MIIFGNFVLTLFAMAAFVSLLWLALEWSLVQTIAVVLWWAGLLTGMVWVILWLWS
jgi:hypothetical protein